MNIRNAALAVTSAVALAAAGVILWALLSGNKSSDTPSSITVTHQASASDQVENETSDARKFKVDVLLAPMGFRVDKDYVLEIAKSSEVHSSRDSHLDSTDHVFYSAAVVNGVTELPLSNGSYEVCIYPDGHPDNFKRYSWNITDSTTDKDLQLIVTEKVGEGQMMIVLHWGSSPKDLDAYLTCGNELVYAWNRDGKSARLDTDSVEGSGIETVTITDMNGDYLYTVDNYSREITLGKSGAVVEVFTSENRNPEIFNVPENIDEVWDVFRVENGKIVPVNSEGAMICPQKIYGFV